MVLQHCCDVRNHCDPIAVRNVWQTSPAAHCVVHVLVYIAEEKNYVLYVVYRNVYALLSLCVPTASIHV